MTNREGDVAKRHLTIHYLDWDGSSETEGSACFEKGEIAVQLSKLVRCYVTAPHAQKAFQTLDRKLLALVSFGKPYLVNSCRWCGDVEVVAANTDERGLADCIIGSLGDEQADAFLVNENGDLTRIEWQCGVRFSIVWQLWTPTVESLVLYQVGVSGSVTPVELGFSLPEGVCDQEPTLCVQPIPPWQMFVPYLKDSESQIIVVQFDFDVMPVMRKGTWVTEEHLRTLACIGNRRFLVRCGDEVDLSFEKSGFDQPIIISGV